MRWCLLLLIAVTAQAESLNGTITVVESLRGPSETSERDELERLVTTIEARLRQHREALVTAKPLTARILKEDLGFLTAEQERIVLRGGGDLAVATTTFTLHQGRLLQTGDDARLQVDRYRMIAMADVGGTIRPLTLAPLPTPTTDAGEPGPMVLGRATRQRHQRIQGHPATTLAVEGLPNPWALGLLEGTADDDVAAVLATLPGLPVMATWEDGGLTKRLDVTAITPAAVDERLFIPWTATP